MLPEDTKKRPPRCDPDHLKITLSRTEPASHGGASVEGEQERLKEKRIKDKKTKDKGEAGEHVRVH